MAWIDEKDEPESDPEQDEDYEGMVLYDADGNLVEIRNVSQRPEYIFTPTWDDLEEKEENGRLAIEYDLDDKPHHDPDYDSLRKTLNEALEQASNGKGMERHADKEPFEKQTSMIIAKLVKDHLAAPFVFQAIKKAVESKRLSPSHAIHELLGAINYIAMSIILLKEEIE